MGEQHGSTVYPDCTSGCCVEEGASREESSAGCGDTIYQHGDLDCTGAPAWENDAFDVSNQRCYEFPGGTGSRIYTACSVTTTTTTAPVDCAIAQLHICTLAQLDSCTIVQLRNCAGSADGSDSKAAVLAAPTGLLSVVVCLSAFFFVARVPQ